MPSDAELATKHELFLDFQARYFYIFRRHSRRGGEIGRRTGFKIQRSQEHAGSIPALGTLENKDLEALARGLFCYGMVAVANRWQMLSEVTNLPLRLFISFRLCADARWAYLMTICSEL